MSQPLAGEGTRIAHATREELLAKALELLEFPKIREQLAAHTTFYPTREMALALEPAYTQEEVNQLQGESREAHLLLEQYGDVGISHGGDIRPSLKRASLGGVLTGQELLEVAAALDVLRRARSSVNKARKQAPTLFALAQNIPDLKEINRQIKTSIGKRGEVVDGATPILGELRHRVRGAYDRLVEALNGIIQSPLGLEVLQDQVISTRGERLVLQVKSEMRHRLPGIVHDVSHTGATLFIEPFSTVGLGNAWRELALEEEREVERVLRSLSELLGARAEDIDRGVEVTALLDLVLAKARYGAAIGASSAQAAEQRNGLLRLAKARHPLLGDRAVPINIQIGPGWSALVITGPNTGGKTVALKTAGLLALMHQAGLHIPTDEGSALAFFNGIYADIGDQQSIEQSVSTFSSHMRNVIDILSLAGPGSLVLLDELGTSTDPEEGSALAKAILSNLVERDIATIATTHHRSVAAFAEETPGMMNGSVELDHVTLRPTYHLTIGIPGRSYAMSVAASLGLTDEVLQRAWSLIDPHYLRTEDLLSELQKERHQLQLKLQEAEEARRNAEAAGKELQQQLEEVATTREEMVEEARQELLRNVQELKRRLRRSERALEWSAPPDMRKEARESVRRVERELRESPWRSPEPTPELQPGDRVLVKGLNWNGEVLSLPDNEGRVEVLLGTLRLRLDSHRLSKVGENLAPPSAKVRLKRAPTRLAPFSQKIDLRGVRVDDALGRVDVFLDRAALEGLTTVTIVHGHGTGALRQALREHLARHPLAKGFRPAEPDQGGDGVTVVELI